MKPHVVKQGESVASIAKAKGFRDPKTIWDHADNAELRERRDNPEVLAPGDELKIPEREFKNLPVATGRVHKFQVHKTPTRLRVVVKTGADEPLANAQCELDVDGVLDPGKTNADGMVERAVAPNASAAKLTIAGFELALALRELDPVDQPSGWRARLENLGYPVGKDADARRTRLGVEEFQYEHDLKVDGICGPRTQEALVKAHGC